MRSESGGTDSRRRSRIEEALGVLGGLMVAAAVVLLFVGGERDGDAGPAEPPPALRLLEPSEGAVTGPRVEVVFAVEGGVQPIPGGWGAGPHHLHLRVDGAELMPAAADIRRDGDRFRWTVGPLAPGRHTLRLVWSGEDHAPLAEGASREVRVVTR